MRWYLEVGKHIITPVCGGRLIVDKIAQTHGVTAFIAEPSWQEVVMFSIPRTREPRDNWLPTPGVLGIVLDPICPPRLEGN